jgi:hypothetical protein
MWHHGKTRVFFVPKTFGFCVFWPIFFTIPFESISSFAGFFYFFYPLFFLQIKNSLRLRELSEIVPKVNKLILVTSAVQCNFYRIRIFGVCGHPE